MTDEEWYQSYFGDDYLEIHRDDLTADLSQAQARAIAGLLELKPGARVLDLACGHGRHSVALAELGFDVTGYDLSQTFLERAKTEAAVAGVGVTWIHGDMRDLPFDGEFDAVINIFTAFGYFDDPGDDLKVLDGVRRALKPGGRFLLETVHRDALPAKFQNRTWSETSSGVVVLRERHLDLATDVMHERAVLIRPDGQRTEHRMRMRMRSLANYLRLLEQAALRPESWYGGLDGSTLELASWRMVLVGRKEM